ncbi:SOS response-associated peptidase [Blastococcus sp. TML/M2B]|uniref:SOS response-associated peptidase n=1 Tax=unclassified Blastococcus TaxID=2619396 RepID=UPI00190E3715|nr:MULTISPECIES: SOS response-associated peptidase [unclassified Blastococcus]MBN1093714.1 SOS response-associated peptidase [Blastococcus sp. TML/M2B]MBN1096165.1 SOS response-associated peptidase [Blastococcus sp. TML/C7B]
MCGRYAASRKPEDLALEFEAVPAGGQHAVPADYNVAPTKDVHVVRWKKERDAEGALTGGGHRELRAVRWGLVPSWAKDVSIGNRMINARVESLTDKPAFRTAARTRRCIVPADGWYEWAKRLDSPGKQPYFITPQDGSVLALAGLWEVWGRGEDRLYTCTVVTSPAVGALSEIHDRMPLVLPRDRWADWLDPAREDVEQLSGPTPPEVVEALELRPVSTAVNNVANNGRQLTYRAETVAEPADQPALF